MIRYLRVILLSARFEVQRIQPSAFLFGVAISQPFFIGVTAMYLLRHRPDFEAVYVVVGTGLTGLWSLTLFGGTGALSQERGWGSLELLVASPVPLMVILSGRMLGNVAISLASMALSYGIGAWLFGYPIAIHNPPGFGVSMLLALVSLWAMGLLFSPLSILSPATERFLSGLEFPVYILCGFLFSVALLPGWLLPVSYLLPPYWAAAALHGTTSGNMDFGELWAIWSVLAVTSGIVLALAGWCFRVLLMRARREGTLGMV